MKSSQPRQPRRGPRPRPGSARGGQCGAGAAAAGMDGDPAARRAAAGQLSHLDARGRPGPGGPARIPAPRRRAPHRLERHGAAAIPHVRVFTEDREMAAWFLLDLSPSVDFGSGEQRKRNVSADFVAVLARLLTRHGNRVGAMLYGSGVDTVIPTRGGRRHVLHLLHSMQPAPGPDRVRHDQAARPAGSRGRPHQAPLHPVRRFRLHQRARLGPAPCPAGPAP